MFVTKLLVADDLINWNSKNYYYLANKENTAGFFLSKFVFILD